MGVLLQLFFKKGVFLLFHSMFKWVFKSILVWFNSTIDRKLDILSEQLDSVLEQWDKISELDAKIEGLELLCQRLGIL